MLWVGQQQTFGSQRLCPVGQQAELRARIDRPQTSSSPPVILLLAVPRRLFCFGSLVVLDVVFRYLSLGLLYINTKIGKNRCLMLD